MGIKNYLTANCLSVIFSITDNQQGVTSEHDIGIGS